MANKTIVFGKGFLGTRISKRFNYESSDLNPIAEEFIYQNKGEFLK